MDYLATVDGKVVPIEVKSGASGRLRSLHLLLKERPECPYGIVFSGAPFSEIPGQRLRFVPLYHAYAATRSQGADS